MEEKLQSPFPWFGGKARVAPIVWQRFGDVYNYVEPFFGSGAVLLGRPDWHTGHIETANDLDGYIANFWRAVTKDPEATARFADNPVFECDLHARHSWLLKQKENLVTKLEGDPDYYDAKIAGWWAWCISSWIGSGFCSGQGPWAVNENNELVKMDKGEGISRQLPRLSGSQGVNRKRPQLMSSKGVNRKRPQLMSSKGVNRQLPHLGDAGKGINRPTQNLLDWFEALSNRLRYVRVCCGDWTRVLGPSPTFALGLTGVFLDPPYSGDERDNTLYTVEDLTVADKVKDWAVANGDNPLLRIALCGYEGEHEMPPDWDIYHWKASGGYGSQGNGRGRANAKREVIYFSPYCLKENQTELDLKC